MASSKGTILLTGANGGLGCGIVSQILSTPELVHYHGVYAVRDASSASALKSTLERRHVAHSYEILSLELSLLADVREFAQALHARIATGEIPPIRALILCAGYNDLGQQSATSEGFETSFASNYLGHWLLTMLLLRDLDVDNGRIVVLGSSSYDVNHPTHKIDGCYADEKWKTFFQTDNIDAIARGTWSRNEGGDLPRRAGVRRYGVSKMCFVMMIGELQRRLDADPALKAISITGIDPGVMGTGLVRRGNWFTRVLLWPIIIPFIAPFLTWLEPNGHVRTISKSSADVLQAVFEASPELRGKYMNGSEVQEVVPEAADTKKREMVWRDSVKYSQLTDQETALMYWT